MELQDIDKCFIILEVDKAEPVVGKLFRRRFGIDTFPKEPRHFIAFAIMEDGSLLSIGYVHYTMWAGCALCGGLVIDDRHYRRLSKTTRRAIQNEGGIAELLLRQTFARLPQDTIAIWGNVGDMQSEKVCLRAGFVKTERKYLLVVWRSLNLTDDEKTAWIDRAYAMTPF